jgi:uncharacterized coiled-coil protein SlyX
MPMGLTRDTWVKIIIWLAPMIFMAGTLYVSLTSTMARQDDMEDQMRALTDRTNTMAVDQRVLQEHVAALRLSTDRVQDQLDKMQEQLSSLKSDTAAIRQKLSGDQSKSR